MGDTVFAAIKKEIIAYVYSLKNKDSEAGVYKRHSLIIESCFAKAIEIIEQCEAQILEDSNITIPIYELWIDDVPGAPCEMHSWIPISTDMIKNPDKIPGYIATGLLRKIVTKEPGC